MSEKQNKEIEQRDNEAKLLLTIRVKLNVVNVKITRLIGQVIQKIENLRLPEWRILSLLAGAGGLTQSDIRVQIGMDKGQISRAVKSMLASGLVENENENGSVKSGKMLLSLTKRGWAVHQKVDDMMVQLNTQLLSNLSTAEKKSLSSSLDVIGNAADNWV